MTARRETLWTLLARLAEEDADRVLIRTRAGDVTRGSLAESVTRLSGGLAALGIGPGDRVAVFAENRPEHFTLAFALNRIGAAYSPVNPLYRGDLVENAFDVLRPAAVVVDRACRPVVEPYRDRSDRWVEMDRGVGLPGTVADYAELEADVDTPPEVVVDPGKGAVVLFTSGTTGPSKGVAMSDRFCLEFGAANAQARDLRHDDVLYSCFAFCHASPIGYSLVPALLSGAEMAWAPRFSASAFWADVRDLGATQFAAFSATILMLLAQPPRETDATHGAQVCFSVGAPRGDEFSRRFGVRIIDGYGLSECGALAYDGVPVDGWTVAVVDDNDLPVAARTIGEIVGRPERPGMIMDGYLGRPAETLDVYRNLWFHTGDNGYLNEAGKLHFVGRKKDAMRHRGENISAWEVEQAVLATGLVHDCAAYALPSSSLGEDDVAVAVVPASADFDPAALLAALPDRLPKYAVPAFVRTLADLPRTPTGKVKKHELRAAGATPDTWRSPRATEHLVEGNVHDHS
ncbi:MAG: AMP-binding protein [Micromonosporaceae bacterium]|nr:AMP-binding protein [Micromonosporaceae bacterium]